MNAANILEKLFENQGFEQGLW